MNNRIEDFLGPDFEPEEEHRPISPEEQGSLDLEGAVMVTWLVPAQDTVEVPVARTRSVIGWPLITGEEDVYLSIASELSKDEQLYGMVTRIPRAAVLYIIKVHPPEGDEDVPAWA